MTANVSRRTMTGRVIGICLLLGAGAGGYILITYLSLWQTSPAMRSAYHVLALNVALIFGALASGRLPSVFFADWDAGKVGPAILAASYVLAGVALWHGLAAFSFKVSVMPGVGLVCLTGAAAIAASHLAVYAERREFGGSISGLFRWLAETRSLVLAIGLLAGVYAFMIRPLFVGKATYSVLMEWTLILLLGVIVLGISHFRIGRGFVEDEGPLPIWRCHEQQLNEEVDTGYEHLRNLERHFVNESDRTMLLHYLISLLARNGVGEEDIAAVLKPMIEYRPRHTWIGGKIQREQAADRGCLLTDAVSAIQTVAQPSRYRTQTALTPEALGAVQERKTVSRLAEEFCREADCSRLLVRLSLLSVSAGTRNEDIGEVLRPLLTHRETSQSGRERLWQEVTDRVGRYAPRVTLKE